VSHSTEGASFPTSLYPVYPLVTLPQSGR